MVSKEDLELVQKAQKAILKLDGGGIITGGEQEHLDLSRAITKLSGMVLFHSMTEKDIEEAKAIFKEMETR